MAATKKAKKKATAAGPAFPAAVKKAFNQPSGAPQPNPIGAEGVVIGAKDGTFYYVIEKNGKYFYEDSDGTLHELPKVPKSGQGVLKVLTQRGSLLADIDRTDTGGIGGYCYLLSVENLTD